MKKLDVKGMQFEIDSSKTKKKIKGWEYMYKKDWKICIKIRIYYTEQMLRGKLLLEMKGDTE